MRDKLVTGVQTCALPIFVEPEERLEVSGLTKATEAAVPGVTLKVVESPVSAPLVALTLMVPTSTPVMLVVVAVPPETAIVWGRPVMGPGLEGIGRRGGRGEGEY